MSAPRLPFIDLTPGEDTAAVREAIHRVLDRGWFILGPEVEAFEREFARESGARHAVAVGNGTDALALILRALGIGAGQEVIVPALTAAYTGLAVMMAGAQPVFADVLPDTLTIDPRSALPLVNARTAAILPVHLYGQAVDMTEVGHFADRHHLAIVEDCCQAHLATSGGKPVGTIGAAGAFSFYPTKNLGALGDGGAVVTNDGALADRLRRLRNGGQSDRYHHIEAGVNSRLDEMQAAVLRARLPFLRRWTDRRRALAAAYRRTLPHTLPVTERDPGHVYHLFPVLAAQRAAVQEKLRAVGIETLIHYPVPIPRQPALAGERPDQCPVADRACAEVFSLPLYPALPIEAIAQVAEVLSSIAAARDPAS